MNIFKVTLGDIEREVKFTTRALCRLEQELGYSVLSSEFLSDRTIARVVKTLWAGLLHQNKDLTIDDIFELIDLSGTNILQIMPVITQAFNHYWGIDSAEEEKEEKKTEA